MVYFNGLSRCFLLSALYRHPGHRRRHDQIDVRRGEARLLERAGEGPASEFDRVLDEDVVRRTEVGQR
jgi:hypothetical protein